MAPPNFDPSVYTRAPIFNIGAGITLCGALVDACPPGAPAPVKKARKKLAQVTDAARAAFNQRKQQLGKVSDASVQLLDQEADWSWAALRMRLQAYALLPAARYPLAPRAAELVTVLFGAEGLEFLKFPYPEQLASMGSLLERITDEGLAKEIDALAGKEFLAQARDVQPRYDAMVKLMLQRDESTGESLLDHVHAMQSAIVTYANKVTALVDDDEPETVEMARKALRAIDNHRVSLARRASASKGAAPEDAADAPADGEKPNG